MADLTEAYDVLRKADAAGDTAAVAKVMAYIKEQEAAPAGKGKAPATAPAPAAAVPQAPAEPQSSAGFLLDSFKQGVSNTAALAGSPVSLVSGALKLLHVIPQDTVPVGGMEQVKKGWDGLVGVKGIKAPKDPYGAESKSTEYQGKIAEFAGGMLFPGTSAVANASRKLATAVTLAIGTTESALFSVKGKDVGERLAPTVGLSKEEGGKIGEMVGGFVGPGLTSKIAQHLVKAGNFGAGAVESAGITGLSKDAQAAAANKILNAEIMKSLKAAPNSDANVARALRLKAKAEQFSPNLPQMTDAPGLVAMYKEVANKSPEALAKASEADRKNLEAIANYKDKVFPKAATPELASLTRPAKIKLAADRSVITMAMEKVDAELSGLSMAFRRQVDNEAIGKELRAKYWSARDVARAGVTQLYEGAGGVYQTAKKYGIQEDMTDMRDSVAKIIGADRTTFQNMPPTFAKILQEYPAGTAAKTERTAVTRPRGTAPIYRNVTTPGKAGKSQASFEEVHSLYKQANRDWVDATVAGDSTKAHYMKMVRDQLQEKVNKYYGPQYGELATKFGAANAAHAKYSTVFREGAGGEIAKRGRGGLTTDAEDIVRKTFLGMGDKKRGVQDFFELYGHDERAAQLLHDGLVDNYSKAAVKDGMFDPKAAQRWIDAHHNALGELPESKKIFLDAKKSGEMMVDRKMALQAERRDLDRTELAKVAKSEKPEQLVRQAIGDPKLMRALLAGAYSQGSKDAVARSIADVVLEHPQAYEFLEKNAASLKPVMEQLRPGHWQNLMDIAEMGKISARTRAPTTVELGKVQDIGEKVIGTSLKGLFSRLRNLDKPMGVSKEYLLFDVGGRFVYKIRTEELARMRESALFDPNVAEVLAKLAKQTTYSQRDLLDLQKMGFAAGVVSTAEAVAVARGR